MGTDEVAPEFIDLVAWAAITFTALENMTGLPTCVAICKRGTTRGISSATFVAKLFNSSLWLEYGTQIGDDTLVCASIISVVFQVAYITFYYFHCLNKFRIQKQIIISTILIFFAIIYLRHVPKAPEMAGRMALFAAVALCASPLLDLCEIAYTQDPLTLPVPFVSIMFMYSVVWLLYGFLQSDLYLVFPSTIGSLISGMQLLLFYFLFPKQCDYDD